ncbi:MAG: MFS transporter [Bryobacteraceae bacterium]|nr:MFS transporter [Bryobacteraceae bacterium]
MIGMDPSERGMTRSWLVALRRLSPSIWALGLTSLFMDISSELVHSLLPIFMSSVLGASILTIGVIEGIAEATASVTKVLSGVLSDYWSKRKSLVVFGYGLSALTKPMFPLASSIGWIAAARFFDRMGKGVRGAPRDALMADLAPADLRGAAYGLRQALDSVGAFLGPVLAIAFMALLNNDIRGVFWVGVVSALVAVAVLVTAVPEPNIGPESARRTPISARDARRLGPGYWLVVTLAAMVSLSRFSEAFLVLRAQHVGISITFVPIVMIVMNAVYAIAAYPAGSASDKHSRRTLLLLGLIVLIASDLVLATASSVGTVLAGAALWGLHMALTQGLFSRLVADIAPTELRGTAFGAFNLVTGVSVLLASVIAGALWNSLGPEATFFAGAVFAAAAAMGLAAYRIPTAAA